MASWTKDQVRALIEIYEEEPCLYAIKHSNYHNKNLRNVALERVAEVVRVSRPNVSANECQAEIHTLRNQFNIENSKRRSSLNKSGSGAADVYVLSLWYSLLMTFLDEHYVPMKSKSSRIGTATEENGSQSMESSAIVVSGGFDENDHFNVFLEEDEECDGTTQLSQILSPASPLQMSESPLSSTPVRPLTTSTQVNQPIRPESAPPVSQTPSTSSTCSTGVPSPASSTKSTSFLPPTNRPSKRKKNEDTAFVGAIEAIAQTLKEPTPAPQPSTETSPVDACMTFLGSMLKTFKSTIRQIDITNKLVHCSHGQN